MKSGNWICGKVDLGLARGGVLRAAAGGVNGGGLRPTAGSGSVTGVSAGLGTVRGVPSAMARPSIVAFGAPLAAAAGRERIMMAKGTAGTEGPTRPGPVLVAGAGPVGLTLAVELARYGVPVRIIDRALARSDKSKALAVWPRTLELLERAGCAADFVAAGVRCPAANIFAGTERVARVAFGEVASPYPFALLLPQSETERLLESRLSSLGITVERGTTLEELVDDGEAVACRLQRTDGTTERARAPWLVGCDGAHSTVRQALGLDFAGVTLPQSFVLADIHVAGLAVPTDEMAIYWSAEGTLLFFPIGGGRCRIIADVGSEPRHDPTLGEIQAIVAARAPRRVTLSDPVWLAGFSINERMVRRYRAGRVFVAGDAAHIHSPAGGQGMNTGMQDAVNLAWKLALVTAGAAAGDLLDSYSAERTEVARAVLTDSGRMTRAGLLHNPLAQGLRNLVVHGMLGFAGARNRAATHLSELSVGYPDSPLNRGFVPDTAGIAPGDRLVAGAPFGAGDTPRFALLAPEVPQARSLLADFPTLLEPEIRPPLAEGMIHLVRPDGYIAGIGSTADGWTALRTCLTDITPA